MGKVRCDDCPLNDMEELLGMDLEDQLNALIECNDCTVVIHTESSDGISINEWCNNEWN